jgi:hypothetical protein
MPGPAHSLAPSLVSKPHTKWVMFGRDLSALWARGWRTYAQARGLDVGSGPLETAFRLRHALGLLADSGDPAVVGTIEEHLAQL